MGTLRSFAQFMERAVVLRHAHPPVESGKTTVAQVKKGRLAFAIPATNGDLLLGKKLPSGNARVIINGLLFINPIFLNHVGTRLSRERC